ncbi:hypothetical protein BH23GEM3_BH23GEM3_04290 [soil metagenome]|nr:DUF4174 domain-containing protein [Gemmatimonadota bacterium]
MTLQNLEHYQWKNRPFLIFAPSETNSAYGVQARRLDAERDGARDREMVLFEIVAHAESRAAGEPLEAVTVDAIRKRFGVGEDKFAVILVGKDGTQKRRWSIPVEMEEVFALIDSMPMRHEEMAE